MTHICYAKSSGLGGGELGLRKTPGPEFASILATLYLILLCMVFMKREALSSMYDPPLFDPATLVRAKLQVPASALCCEPFGPHHDF
jgi:hypothetical protein